MWCVYEREKRKITEKVLRERENKGNIFERIFRTLSVHLCVCVCLREGGSESENENESE